MPIDAQGMTLTVNGETVGGIESYDIYNGDTPPIEHNKLDGSGREFFPGVPNYGDLILNAYIDPSDAGQQELESTRTNRTRVTCVLTPRGGTAQSFLGFARIMPIIGENVGVQTSRIVVKVAGPIS